MFRVRMDVFIEGGDAQQVAGAAHDVLDHLLERHPAAELATTGDTQTFRFYVVLDADGLFAAAQAGSQAVSEAAKAIGFSTPGWPSPGDIPWELFHRGMEVQELGSPSGRASTRTTHNVGV